MSQLSLFNEITPLEAIKNGTHGLIFFSPSEICSILDLTIDQVYYAIENYRLDALFICGKYMIPGNSIVEYAKHKKDIERFEYYYSRMMKKYEDLDSYIERKEAATIYNKKAPIKEKYKDDYYNLEALALPDTGDILTWSDILRVNPYLLIDETGYNALTEISKADMLDYLIDNELVNREIFVD